MTHPATTITGTPSNRATRQLAQRGELFATHWALGFVILLLLAATGTAKAEMERWTLDPEHTSIGFLVDHAGYAKTLGMFREMSGHFDFDRDSRTLGTGVIEIETASVFTNHDGRDNHLRNRDFLSVERHPKMIFRAERWESTGEDEGLLHGTLELLGETRPLVLGGRINRVARYPFPIGGIINRPLVLGASLRGSFNRGDFGMTYGLRPMELVGNTVELIIEFEARRD